MKGPSHPYHQPSPCPTATLLHIDCPLCPQPHAHHGLCSLPFPTTPKPPPPTLGHAITRMTIYCLSPDKLNKIPQKQPREGGTGCLSQSSHPQSSSSQIPVCLQLPARSDAIPEGQSSSSLAICAIPVWAVFAHAQLSPGHTALLRL